jgi:hypothetical protein
MTLVALPSPNKIYDYQNEAQTRRIIELALAAGAAPVEAAAPTSKFTPATPGIESFWNQTVSLITCDVGSGSTAFTDEKGKAITVVASVVGSVLTAKQGYGSSALFASGAVLREDNAAAKDVEFEFNDGPMTIEGWFKTTQNAQQFTTIAERSNASFNGGSWSLFINSNPAGNDGKVSFWLSDFSTVAPLLLSASNKNDGAWHHVAVVRFGNTFLMFIDGLVENTQTGFTGAFGTGNNLYRLGNSIFATRDFVGNLQAWRVLRGVAAYTVNFTVPGAPFPGLPPTSGLAAPVITSAVQFGTSGDERRMVSLVWSPAAAPVVRYSISVVGPYGSYTLDNLPNTITSFQLFDTGVTTFPQTVAIIVTAYGSINDAPRPSAPVAVNMT